MVDSTLFHRSISKGIKAFHMSLRPTKVYLVFLLFITSACAGRQEPAILEALKGDWTTKNVLGEEETIRFEKSLILWRYGTEGQYECPYCVTTYHKTKLYVYLRLCSERRTGSNTWIKHRLLFNEGLDEFTMAHGEEFETIDGVFRPK